MKHTNLVDVGGGKTTEKRNIKRIGEITVVNVGGAASRRTSLYIILRQW